MDSRVESLLSLLRTDRGIVAAAPCNHTFPLHTATFAYGVEAAPGLEKYVSRREERIRQLDAELSKLTHAFSEGSTQKSTEVMVGKTMEKLLAALPGFPYARVDVRPVFDPIDYIAFDGMNAGALRRIDFLEVKTGEAVLKPIQKSVRKTVDNQNVTLKMMP